MQPQIIHSPNRPLTPAARPLITPAPPLERLDLSQTQIHPSMVAALVGASLGSVTQCIIAGNSLGDVATEDIAQVLRGGDEFSRLRALTGMCTCQTQSHHAFAIVSQVVSAALVPGHAAKWCLDLSKNGIHGPAALRLVCTAPRHLLP